MIKASTSPDFVRYRSSAAAIALLKEYSPTPLALSAPETLDAVPDMQSNARLEVRTRTGRDSQAIEKRVNKHPAAHLRCTQSY